MKDLDARMRELEAYHGLRVPNPAWTVVRVDGRSFSGLTEKRFIKPFDPAFHELMNGTAQTLLEATNGILAFHESDEISILLRPDFDFFDREVEKIVSGTAAIASVAFSLAFGSPAHFDSRIVVFPDVERVLEYFNWRLYDAARCCLNGWAHWTLIQQEHKTARQSAAILDHMYQDGKLEILARNGIDFATIPAWQRRGTIVAWETYEKQGFNPITQQPVTAQRRRLVSDSDLPNAGYPYEVLLVNTIAAFLNGTPLEGAVDGVLDTVGRTGGQP